MAAQSPDLSSVFKSLTLATYMSWWFMVKSLLLEGLLIELRRLAAEIQEKLVNGGELRRIY